MWCNVPLRFSEHWAHDEACKRDDVSEGLGCRRQIELRGQQRKYFDHVMAYNSLQCI
jgi:hypothetical protein